MDNYYVAKSKVLTRELNKLRAKIRQAVADYMQSESCGCCGDREQHQIDAEALGKLLNVRKYKDGSGRDFSKYKTKGKKRA